MQEKLFDMLCNKDDISWQSMIYESVRSQQMDPWDVNISTLAARFLDMIRQLKEMDFKISGKIILAAAILLRLKSHKLITDDLSHLDRLIAMSEETEDAFYDELLSDADDQRVTVDIGDKKVTLVPRTPQPRKRKVSVYDLVEALEQALEVKNRRNILHEDLAQEVKAPEHYDDIDVIIAHVFEQIKQYFVEKQDVDSLKFSSLLKTGDRKEKLYTFSPLLHLSNQRQVELVQQKPFEDFDIYLLTGGRPVKIPEVVYEEPVVERKKLKKAERKVAEKGNSDEKKKEVPVNDVAREEELT